MLHASHIRQHRSDDFDLLGADPARDLAHLVAAQFGMLGLQARICVHGRCAPIGVQSYVRWAQKRSSSKAALPTTYERNCNALEDLLAVGTG